MSSSTRTDPDPPAPEGRSITIRRRRIPVILPNRRDPRLRLSVVIMTLQLLGQTVLDFKVSIAQIIVTIAFSASVEIVITFRREAMLVWPASAMLTGSSVAFILRTAGTRHGDWWSLNGIRWFLLAALLSLLSKYLIRPGDRHLFNPSNVGLVWCLLIIGPRHVFPQYLWWGPGRVGQALAYAVIFAGAWWILRKVRMVGMAVAFLTTFAVLAGILALAGRDFVAIWHDGPISGLSYWANLAMSPELLIFVFFMISDPQTAPRAPLGRVIYGAATATLAAGLLSFQTTEFAIKLSILSSLTVVCALVPLLENVVRRLQVEPELRRSAAVSGALPRWRQVAAGARNPVIVAAAIITLAAPLNTAALAGDDEVVLIEKGLAGKNAQ
ncbi:MAG TPA: RnfABCDGE type electron transport complex subunit D [Acidimicrobiales bacterium]|nr:RnfABCDGE type electron transport complex subunit D [Acidimicrobiales bacterium]